MFLESFYSQINVLYVYGDDARWPGSYELVTRKLQTCLRRREKVGDKSATSRQGHTQGDTGVLLPMAA